MRTGSSWRLALLTVAVFTFSFSGSARGASLPFVWGSPASVDAHSLTGIACPSVSLCVAVDDAGDVVTSTNPAAGLWTVTTVPGAAGFSGVSCPSTSLCVAVDRAGHVATASAPNGGAGAWSVTQVSDHPLSAVSCSAVTMCAATVDAGAITSLPQAHAAGTVIVSTAPQVTGSWVAEHADGYLGFECGKYTQWGNCSNSFTGLSCPTATSLCIASDHYGNVVSSADPAAGASATWGWDNGLGAAASGTNAVSCVGVCVGTCVAGFGYVLTPCPGSYDAADLVTWDPASNQGGDNSSIRYATFPGSEFSGVWCESSLAPLVSSVTSACFAAQWGQLLVSNDPTGGVGAWSVTYVDPGEITGVACAAAFCVVVDAAGQATVGVATVGPPTVGPTLTSSQIQALLRRQLVPMGRAARIRALVRHDSYTLHLNAATAGRLRISWYACRRCSPAAARRKVKVASGARTYSGATTLRIRLRLTRRGKQLLRASRRLQITAVAGFTPSGEPAITATRSFRLRR